MSVIPDFLEDAIRRANEAMGSTRFTDRLDYESQELAYDAMEVSDVNTKFQLAANALEVFPLCIDAWNALGYHFLNQNRSSNAIDMFESGVRAGRQIHPEWGPDRTDALVWGCVENRPYLRAMMGLSKAQRASGNLQEAIEVAELVHRWHEHCTLELWGWYMEANRLEDAAAIIAEKGEKDIMSCSLAYTRVLLMYAKFQQGHQVAETDLDRALGEALKRNLLVPDMLQAQEPPRGDRPDSYSTGEETEAKCYVMDNYALWRRFPGAVDWLSSMRARNGAKPDEQALVKLLKGHALLIELEDGSSIRGTQDKEQMIGRGLPDFRLRPEVTLPHKNGSPIHIHLRSWDRSLTTLWKQVLYDNIRAVPYWCVFLEAGDVFSDAVEEIEGESPALASRRCHKCAKLENPDSPLRACSACKLISYCSKACQRKDWKKHKPTCIRFQKSAIWRGVNDDLLCEITSYLNLRDKAAVCILNKAWLKAATSDIKVTINPDEVGPDVDSVLAFVSNRFRNLQHVSISIDQGCFLGMNDETLVRLSGGALNNFFRSCHPLKSVRVRLGECCEEQLLPILVEQQGLSSISRHASLEELSFGNAIFETEQSLIQLLQPLTNLRVLNLDWINFVPSMEDFELGWISQGDLAVAIGNLVNLRKLSLQGHGFTDNGIRSLLPILGELRSLKLEGTFVENGGPVYLTDISLQLISERCPKLQVLEISYQRRVSADGIHNVVRACPLRELAAHDTALNSSHLEDIAMISSTLMLVRYGRGFGRFSTSEDEDLRRASIASGGRTIFFGSSIYKPTFDEDLMQEHKRSYKRISECTSADSSNGWNEWEDLL